MMNCIWILFASPLLGLLAGKSQAPENLPRVTLVVPHAEFPVDDLCYSFAGPEIRAVAGLDGTGQENLYKPPLVRSVQTRRSTGSRFGGQGFHTAFQDGLFPPFDRRKTRADNIGHFLKWTALQQKTARNTSTGLPFYVRSCSSAHASFYAP